MDKLLPYYEQELSLFMRQSKAFAEAYPKVASRLMMTGESVEDPHVERLIQAFSLISARIHKKLDDGYKDFSSALFEVLYPAYLKPFPSCSIASLEQGVKLSQLTESIIAKRGTMLTTKPYHGVSCRFKTVYPVHVIPLAIDKICFNLSTVEDVYQYTNASLKINFKCLSPTFDVEDYYKHPVRLFLDTTPSSVAQLRDIIFAHTSIVYVGASNANQRRINNPFTMVGFLPEDSLLPIDDHSHHAYRLISEYFAFSEKFNFIELDLNPLRHVLASNPDTFFIEFRFKLDAHDTKNIKAFSQLDDKSIKLFCTPVVNLFEKPAEPIKINHKQLKYHLIPDTHHPQFYEIYSINRLSVIREEKNKQESLHQVVPFFSLNHAGEKRHQFYYHITREEESVISNSGYDYQITLVDHQFDAASVQADYLSSDLLCTNRQLPSQIPFGLATGDLSQDNNGSFRQIRFLRKPTPSYRFNHAKEGNWRIISHLSLNTLAFSENEEVGFLKEALTLYELPHSAYNLKQIEGFKSIQFKPATSLVQASPYPLFIRGIEVRVGIEQSSFIGTGLYLIGQLLSYFFGLRVSLNNFIKVILVDNATGQELLICQPLNGFRKLV